MIDLMDKIFKTGELYTGFMSAVLEAARASGDKADSPDTLNEIYDQMTRRYLRFYEESVGKLLSVPQFGISREPLEQTMSAVDAWYRFMAAISDFTVKFNIPLKEAFEVITETLKEREGTDGGAKSAKEVYDFAVGILDEKYDRYIKSPQGVQLVVGVVEKYLDFKKKSDVVKDGWFKSLAIPTSGEMEDVYRGIYELRKKTRKQAAMIRDHEALINDLSRKVLALEAALAEAPKRG